MSESDFKAGSIDSYIEGNRVSVPSLKPYLFFSENNYTRNLIFRNELFELLALCWAPGHVSSIHDHAGENCWMAVPVGKLRIQNFRVLEQDLETGYCKVEPTASMDIDKLTPAGVDPTEPIHQVLNLEEFGRRAVSLHVYSRPIDRCLIYSPSINLCSEVMPTYTSEGGALCRGVVL